MSLSSITAFPRRRRCSRLGVLIRVVTGAGRVWCPKQFFKWYQLKFEEKVENKFWWNDIFFPLHQNIGQIGSLYSVIQDCYPRFARIIQLPNIFSHLLGTPKSCQSSYQSIFATTEEISNPARLNCKFSHPGHLPRLFFWGNYQEKRKKEGKPTKSDPRRWSDHRSDERGVMWWCANVGQLSHIQPGWLAMGWD